MVSGRSGFRGGWHLHGRVRREGEAEPVAATSHFSHQLCTRKPLVLSSSPSLCAALARTNTSPRLLGSCELMRGTRAGREAEQKE